MKKNEIRNKQKVLFCFLLLANVFLTVKMKYNILIFPKHGFAEIFIVTIKGPPS